MPGVPPVGKAGVLAPGGHLLFVVPVGGVARIQFNAHRIYTHAQVLAMGRALELKEFALIPDDGAMQGLVRHAAPALANAQRYGCGCFLFSKHVGENNDQDFERFFVAEAGVIPKILTDSLQRKPELTTRLHGNLPSG